MTTFGDLVSSLTQRRFAIGLFILVVFATSNNYNTFNGGVHASSLTRGEDLKRINQLKSDVDRTLINGPPDAFYNYSLICGGKMYESRAERSFVDKTIPERFRKVVQETYTQPEFRANKCPKWSNNVETRPKSGSMDVISIPENTQVGEKVYLLLAMDPEQEPIYYFIRKAETEVENDPDEAADDIIFRVNVIKMGFTWIGEVILDKPLDFERKKTYNYLTYAYDGFNLLEKYSLVEVIDVDDEKPTVETRNNTGWNAMSKRFEFSVFENASVGEIINAGRSIRFNDVDTQSSQLTIRLVNLETDMADSPFNLNNQGELTLTSKLDYESHKEYHLKIRVQDVSNQFAEELIHIEVIDVADLPPKFVLPKLSGQDLSDVSVNTKFMELPQMQQSTDYFEFYENTIGKVFDVRAVSQNRQPLGKITYRLERIGNPEFALDYFDLSFNRTSSSWYLECLRKIQLEDREEEIIDVTIRAIESSPSSWGPKLFTDIRVNVKIVNGDFCPPKFNKDVYDFTVLEGVKQLLEPIMVQDCDHGINGRIHLRTTRENDFAFKIDQVYRFSKLGIQMQRAYDYEDEELFAIDHTIEFEIVASGSNSSINRFETRAKVRVRIKDLNEFAPRFVLPPPAVILKDGIPTPHTQRIFTYNVPENRNFSLEVKAIDDDSTGNGHLFYNTKYLHPADNFNITSIYHSDTGIFTVTVPGRFLDAGSLIPIVFGVYAEDLGEPKLKSEIIVYLRPQSVELKPAYFEFERYEFRMVENDPKPMPFELRLINDNLGRNRVSVREIHDPLGLLSFDYEENLATEGDIVAFMQNDFTNRDIQPFTEFSNDLIVNLYVSDSKRDFDQLYVDNNRSDVYEYKLRAEIKDRPDLFTDVTVLIKLIDSNDNRPRLVGESKSSPTTIVDARVSEDFFPNQLVSLLKIRDADFSPEYGLPSVFCRLNDTRFYIETERMMHELMANSSIDRVSVPVRVSESARFSGRNEPVVWLNVTCEDNSFARKLKPRFNTNPPIIVRVSVAAPTGLSSFAKSGSEWFDQEQFVFVVDENQVDVLGDLATTIRQAAEELKLKTVYSIEGPERLRRNLKINNKGQLEVVEPFDFERGDVSYNFTVVAQLSDPLDSTKNIDFKTLVTLIINDLNDEEPHFTQDSYEFVLNAKKDEETGSNKSKTTIEVGSVYAIDLDNADQGKLEFSLVDGDAESFTIVKRGFGECAIFMPVSMLVDKSQYMFRVRVNDTNKHSNAADVIVRVQSTSVFKELVWSQEEAYSSSIKENSPPGTQVIGVNITAKGLINRLEPTKFGYKLAEPNEYYEIEETSGVIRTKMSGVPVLDREEVDAQKIMHQTRLYIQAYMDLNNVRYWSKIKRVNVEVLDENDEQPRFTQPADNQTQIVMHPNRYESIFNISAVDNDLNDRVTYSIVEQRLVYSNGTLLKLPFKLNPRNGTLSFAPKEVTRDDFRTLIKHGASMAKVRLTIQAVDKSSKTSTSVIFIEVPVNELIKTATAAAAAQASAGSSKPAAESRIPITYELKSKLPQVVKTTITDETNPNRKKHVYTIDESTPVETPIADLHIMLDASNDTTTNNNKNSNSSKPTEIFENLRLVSHADDQPDYFAYNSTDFTLRLIRPLDYDLVKNLTLRLTGDGLITDANFKIELNMQVKDVNNKPPELELDREERHKYGSNLILVVSNDLSEMLEKTVQAISSTPLPPRQPLPAIPELDLPERAFPQPPVRTPELDQRREALKDFNDLSVVRRYRIQDPDLNNNFTVRILNVTSDEVPQSSASSLSTPRPVAARIEGQTLVIEKTGAPITTKNTISLELNDGINIKNYSGEIYPIFAQHLQRLFTFLPENGRFRGQIYRSSVGSVRIRLDPMIQIENQFPYDIKLNLTGSYAQYFQITPKVVRSSPINISPAQIDLSLRESLDKHADIFQYVTVVELDCTMTTESEYINSLLKAFGPIKIRLDVKAENKFKPEILSFWPSNGKIVLDEGSYVRERVASIEGFDRDRFDPGRLMYHLIGDSNLLDINNSTGEVYLTGTLDAEADQPHLFYCFARDMAPQPFGMNSELVKFEIYVNDVNEFPPLILPSMTSVSIQEPIESVDSQQQQQIEYLPIDAFRFECSDRDINSSLSISLDSIRYVSKYDLSRFVDVSSSSSPSSNSSSTYNLESLFRLVYVNESTNEAYKSAKLTYSNKLDYERLYKPSETFIRLDVSCNDGEFISKSKIFVQVEDRNDNKPRFATSKLVVHRNESNLLQPLVRVQASDDDLSPQYGNYSLEYSLVKCSTDLYDMYIDARTGQISSRLVIDLDTPFIINQRRLMYEQRQQGANSTRSIDEAVLQEQINFLESFNRIKCEVKVTDNQLYNTGKSVGINNNNATSMVSWSDTMEVEIIIDSVNDNAPEIDSEVVNTLIEISEGESTRSMILLKIPVYDKDDASGLVCLFGDGMTTSDPFELKTVPRDPQTTVCVLKVRDDMIVDYDVMRKSFYLLELVVRDDLPPPVYPNTGKARAQLRVRVLPVNNLPPKFANGNEETFYVLDSIRPGTLVGTVLATDMENPNPDGLIYQIDSIMSSPSVGEKFELRTSMKATQSYWGAAGLFIKGKLEVAESPYLITVVAYDGPPEFKDTLWSRKLFKVVVLNKGSMSVWSNFTTGLPVDYYMVQLNEEVPAGTSVCNVTANIPDSYPQSDADSAADIQNHNTVEYSFVLDLGDESVDKEVRNKFYEIDRATGVIVTTGARIDYENEETRREARSLKVKAQTRDKFFTYYTHVVIDIQDVNDNAPQFERESVRESRLIYVVENTTLSDRGVIGRVRATDADSGLNAVVKYRLVTNTTLFHIDEFSGEIICVDGMKIDRETTPFYNLEVMAVDTGDLNSTIELTVTVLDINDNWPQFEPPTIDDNNNNNNNNQQSGFEFKIEENEAQWQLHLNASDLDAGQNGSVLFYLDPSLNPIDTMQKFRIDPITGLVELISPLDYETKTQHRVAVTCIDQGVPEHLKSTQELLIDVIDLNDNGPKFSTPNGERIHVIESIAPGQVITTVRAVDADKTPDYNQINYKLDDDHIEFASLFNLNAESGELSLAEGHRLDYDVQREYPMVIVAYDLQKPVEYHDRVNLTVVVDPSLDKLPVFEQSTPVNAVLFKRSLKESTPDNDYVVEIVRAIDPNQRGIVYSLESVEAIANMTANSTLGEPAPEGLFTIGTDDGVVKARRRRSAYTADAYRLNIRATSKLNSTLSNALSLLVHVDRMSDSLFDSRVFEKSIDENAPVGMFLLQLKPRIKQSSDLILHYEINQDLSSPFSSWFHIDSNNGRIEVGSSEVDCEKSDEVLLTVSVTDSKTSTHLESLLVKVKINDLDDNLPLFEPNFSYDVKMDEDDNSTRSLERLITRFRAHDLDRTPRLSAIDYRIDSVSSRSLSPNSFRLLVDRQTREVSLFKRDGVELDRDDPSTGNKIKLTIIAENPHDTLKFTRKVLIINLLDLNDNAPRIIDSESEITLSESYKLNQAFYHVKALDADEFGTANSELVYGLRPASTKVQIDPNGYLSLVTPLDYETERELKINVEVFDKTNHPLTTSRVYTIKVNNINDNPPQFIDILGDDCEFSVSENAEIGYVLHKFEAIDLDMPNSTDFVFSLDNNNPGGGSLPFSIDTRSGELKTVESLDRELVAEYKGVRVIVQDPEVAGKRLETSVVCTIRVLDVNDNSPKFTSTGTKFTILPIVGEKTLVGFFSATDADSGNNSSIDYFVLNDYNHLFELDQTGHLFLNLQHRTTDKNLDLRDQYEITVTARDRGTPSALESSLALEVRIDQNYFNFNQVKNNKLDLEATFDLLYLNENAPVGHAIGKVRALNSFGSIMDEAASVATSANRTVNLTYSLLSNEDTFRIDKFTGEIEVANSAKLDYERFKEFAIIVEAREVQQMLTFSKERIGKIRLVIKLLNINDMPPRFNRDVYRVSIKESDVRQVVPFDLGLDPLIEITDPDLESGGSISGASSSVSSTGRIVSRRSTDRIVSRRSTDSASGDFAETTTGSAIYNQRNPIIVQLTGPDAESFNAVKVAANIYRIDSRERFDYEIRTSYEFNVTADDGLFKSSSRVIVTIEDVNDNRPVFQRADYSFHIDENSPMHTEVGRVRAVDLDATPENNATLYKITSEIGVFGINERTGLIFVRDPNQLDREKTPLFNLPIVAYNPDSPDLFDTARVLVHLNDLNDETPRFDRPVYSTSIREKWKKLPRLLGKLQARDTDNGENGTVVYSIESINGRPLVSQSPFYIDKVNGYFYLNAFLNADGDVNNSPKQFEVRVVAQDMGGLKDRATVMVTLIDVNDYAPAVIMPKTTEFVQDENSPTNSTIVTIRCVDPDYKHVRVSYELEKDLNRDYESFGLDSSSGVLSNTVEFDYEAKNEYRVRINCIDTGVMINFEDLEINNIDFSTGQMINDLDHSYTHSQVTKLDLVIRVRDLDDNEPEFSELDKRMSKNISEYLEPNSTVTFLPMARDRDTLPENTQVRYVLLPPVDAASSAVLDKFMLNETSGELTLRDELETSERSFYELTVKATSRNVQDMDKRPNDRDPSQITLQLFVVSDRLTVEFEQQNYQVSVKVEGKEAAAPTTGDKDDNDDDDDDNNANESNNDDNDDDDDRFEHGHRMLDLKKRTTRSVLLDDNVLSKSGRADTSIFFARAHLIKRKLKRSLKFSIDMIKLIKYKQNAIIKLSNSLLNRFNKSMIAGAAPQFTADHLFHIDEQTGKVYVSPVALKQGNYRPGDRLLLTISVESRPLHSNDEDLIENAVCQLSVRLVDRDFTIVLPMAHLPLERIYFEFLNPQRESYLPRNFEINGVKIAVQDLVESSSSRARPNLHYFLLVQVESLKPVDLELFGDLWRNYSSLNRYLAEFKSDIGLIEKQPESESRQAVERGFGPDMFGINDNVAFYNNWLFWLLVIIGALLLSILAAFMYCINQNKKKQDQIDKPGIIIEYPPGVNPVFNDGVLSLNSQPPRAASRPTKRRAPTLTRPVEGRDAATRGEMATQAQRHFEEQEAELIVEEEDDFE